MWSYGCILFELTHGRHLFRDSSQVGLLFKIFMLLGTPKEEQWPNVTSLPYFRHNYPQF